MASKDCIFAWSWALLQRLPVGQPLTKFPALYRTKGLLPYLQELSTCLYPEPDQSRPYHPILSPRSILILSTLLFICLPSGLFPPVFATYMHFSFISFLLHALLISSSFTSSYELYLAKSTSYKAPCYAVFSILPSLHPSSFQIFSSTHLLKHPPLMSETKFWTLTEPKSSTL
jgi:hypothetical protein